MKKIFFAACISVVSLGSACAQDYPNKPVRLLVGFGAGGPTDQVARIMAIELSKKFKQSFYVENKPGGNGAIAAMQVISGPTDGSSLLVGTSGALTLSPIMLKSMQYAPMKDLAPVATLAAYPYVLAVHPGVPAKDVPSLISYIKDHPGRVSFGSAGTGSYNHMAGEWLKSIAKVDIVHVPYKGDAPALTDVLGGQVQMIFGTLTTTLPQVKSGKLRALAVTSEEATSLVPGVPSMVQAGYPGFVVEPWNGIFGPAGMPKETITKLNNAIAEILASPDVKQKIEASGQQIVSETPDLLHDRMIKETARWRAIAKAANVQPE